MSELSICPTCGFEIHPADNLRHCGTYVAHQRERCISLLRIHNAQLEATHRLRVAELLEANTQRLEQARRFEGEANEAHAEALLWKAECARLREIVASTPGKEDDIFPPQAQSAEDAEFQRAVREEIASARRNFPSPNAQFAAMVEEVGEVAKALMYEPWGRVVAECVQVASMAQRLAIETDFTMDGFRAKNAAVKDGEKA